MRRWTRKRGPETSLDPNAGEIPEGLGADAPLPARWLVLFLAGIGLAVGGAIAWDELTRPPGGDDATGGDDAAMNLETSITAAPGA